MSAALRENSPVVSVGRRRSSLPPASSALGHWSRLKSRVRRYQIANAIHDAAQTAIIDLAPRTVAAPPTSKAQATPHAGENVMSAVLLRTNKMPNAAAAFPP